MLRWRFYHAPECVKFEPAILLQFALETVHRSLKLTPSRVNRTQPAPGCPWVKLRSSLECAGSSEGNKNRTNHGTPKKQSKHNQMATTNTVSSTPGQHSLTFIFGAPTPPHSPQGLSSPRALVDDDVGARRRRLSCCWEDHRASSSRGHEDEVRCREQRRHYLAVIPTKCRNWLEPICNREEAGSLRECGSTGEEGRWQGQAGFGQGERERAEDRLQ